MKLFKNTKFRIFIVGILLTLLSFLIDEYFVSLILLLQNSFFIKISAFITLLGDIEIFLPVAIIMSVFFFAKKKKLLGLWASIIVVGVTSFLIKVLINRSRPFESQNIASIINTHLGSFPSGHAMIVFSIIPILMKNFPKQKYYFLTIAVLIAFSRVYLNVHYLSDIIAGAFLGYFIGVIFSELEDKYRWK